MAIDIKGYRVFIASPGGLEEEREAFRDTLNSYNEGDAVERGVMFMPVSGDSTLGGVGRPQGLINQDVRRCDYFILILWDRWGSPPDRSGQSPYSSGTEEEYHVASECMTQSMRQMVVMFKAIDARDLTDPGFQLQKVLDFKKNLEAEKNLLYHSFDGKEALQDILRRHLARWVRDHEQGSAKHGSQSMTLLPKLGSPGLTVESSQAEETAKSKTAADAGQLAAAGRLTEAEVAFAQAFVRGDDLDAMNGYGLFLRRMGRANQAQSAFTEALEVARRRHDPVWEAISLNNLALVYYDTCRYVEAEPLFKQALAIREKALRPQHPDIATSLNNLAVLYYDQGRYSEAGALFNRALDIRTQTLGPTHPDVATSLNYLATLYHYHVPDRYAEAERLYRDSLAIQEQTLGPGHPNLGWNLNGLAALHAEQKHYGAAESLFRKALEIREKALGLNHPDLAWSVNGLAALYSELERYDEAEALFERALEIRERALGPNHPDLAWSLDGLAAIYSQRTKYAEAEALCTRGLAIREKALGPNHPDVATSLASYAAVLRNMRHETEAAEMDARARAIREQHAQQNLANSP